MTESKRDEMFDIICKMSDHQVDPIVKNELKEFIGKPNEEVKDKLLILLDKIVHNALTSDFEIKILNFIWLDIGGKKEDLDNRKKPDMYEILDQITDENIQDPVEFGPPVGGENI